MVQQCGNERWACPHLSKNQTCLLIHTGDTAPIGTPPPATTPINRPLATSNNCNNNETPRIKRHRKPKHVFTPSQTTTCSISQQCNDDKINSPENQCKICNLYVVEDGTYCSPCVRWVHYSCAGVTEEVINNLGSKPYLCEEHSNCGQHSPTIYDMNENSDSEQSFLSNISLNDNLEEQVFSLKQELAETTELLDKKTTVAYDQTNRADDLERKNTDLKKQHQTEVNKSKQKVTSILNENTSLHNKISTLQAEKDNLNQALKTENQNIKLLQKQNADLTKTNGSLNSVNQKCAQFKRELDKIQVNFSTMSKENDELKHAMLMKDNQFLQLSKTIDELQMEIAIQKQINSGLLDQINSPDCTDSNTESSAGSPNNSSPSTVGISAEISTITTDITDAATDNSTINNTSGTSSEDNGNVMCQSCTKVKKKNDDLTKKNEELTNTHKKDLGEIRNLKTITNNLESVLADEKTKCNQLTLATDSLTAELKRTQQYCDLLLQNRDDQPSNPNSSAQDQQNQSLPTQEHDNEALYVSNQTQQDQNDQQQLQQRLHLTPQQTPQQQPPGSASQEPQEEEHQPNNTTSHTCPRMWYEDTCTDNQCTLNHNIDHVKKKRGICIYEYEQTGLCKKSNCRFSHNFPLAARSDPLIQNKLNGIRSKWMSVHPKSSHTNNQHPPSFLMHVVTSLEEDGYPPMSWAQTPPDSQRVCPQQPITSPFPPTVSDSNMVRASSTNSNTTTPMILRDAPVDYNIPDNLNNACSTPTFMPPPSTAIAPSMAFLGQLVHQMVNSVLQNYLPLMTNSPIM